MITHTQNSRPVERHAGTLHLNFRTCGWVSFLKILNRPTPPFVTYWLQETSAETSTTQRLLTCTISGKLSVVNGLRHMAAWYEVDRQRESYILTQKMKLKTVSNSLMHVTAAADRSAIVSSQFECAGQSQPVVVQWRRRCSCIHDCVCGRPVAGASCIHRLRSSVVPLHAPLTISP